MIRPWRHARLGLGLLYCSAGCGAAQVARPSAPHQGAVTELSRYAPFEDDTVFSYQTYIEDTNERGIAIFEFKRPRPELAELRIAGRLRKRYYFEPAGVRSSQGGYLLKSPLAMHAQWTGDDGLVTVVAMDQRVAVPAGEFSGCVRTVEEARVAVATRKTTTVFCPGVGITSLEIQAEQAGASVLQRLTLESFGPRFKAF